LATYPANLSPLLFGSEFANFGGDFGEWSRHSTANRANDPFDVRTVLRRSWRAQHFPNAKLFHLLGEIRTEDAVAIWQ